MSDCLRILSLNFHGYNLATQNYLLNMLDNYDIILLQETWLFDRTCSKLDRFADRFTVYHSSSMEHKINSGMTSDRPFGGTAVLLRQGLVASTYRIITGNPRITCVCLQSELYFTKCCLKVFRQHLLKY